MKKRISYDLDEKEVKEAILELARNNDILLPKEEKDWLGTLEDALDTDPFSIVMSLALSRKTNAS